MHDKLSNIKIGLDKMTSQKQNDLLSDIHIAYISKYTKASRDDIASLTNELALDRPDGKMCKDAFRKWLSTMDIKPRERPDASVEISSQIDKK